jgi:primosomal protein N' (replication factor Y)
VRKLASYIGKGIQHKMIVLHGELTKKAFIDAIQKIYADTECVCICSTPHFAHITKDTLELTIVDQESHPNYYSFDTPSVDYVSLFKTIWHDSHTKNLFADTILRIASYRDLDEKKYPREFSIHSRFSHHVPIELCVFEKDIPFSTLTKPVFETLKKMKPTSHNFLYVARKGIHTSMQCSDCGTVVLCTQCSKPTTVQALPHNERALRCLHCGHKETLSKDQELICITCGSWKIKGYGVTTRVVTQELETLFPNKDVYVLDSDISEKMFKKTIHTWKGSGGILVGTDSALPYLEEKLATAAIISCDTWLSMPDIDAHRRLVQVLEPLLEYSHNTVFVQTRIPDEPLFEICKKENITDYIKSELKERKELAHVPYMTFVLLRKDSSFTKKEADSLVTFFPACKPHIYKVHDDIRVLLRITHDRFLADTSLHQRLQGLYPHIIVEVNPQTLFSR